ncbi:UNVERIFIED_ORG: hypothetical protein DFS12_105583 [Chitinophaga ginsengisegetis]|nr:hypothetical protein [Chitinophaga ginsengisegetis]MDR6649139.1 hypothetical protein [Chitinophaga ginsengisegetis]MDR6654912.1 hypothetical protein [Chitinophaga ginsengisegetis]
MNNIAEEGILLNDILIIMGSCKRQYKKITTELYNDKSFFCIKATNLNQWSKTDLILTCH